MGSAVSKNITKAVTEAVAKASNYLITTTKLSVNQSQVISVTDIDGDVHISNNSFMQKANINMKTLMNLLIQEDIQQTLTMEIAQACKSIVSGLNIFQFPNAQNEINLFLKASTEIINDISLNCMSSISENQTIYINRVRGSVYIDGNIMSQIADIFESCVQDAVVKNSIFQKLQEKVNQNATANAEGLNLWQIIILMAIVLGIPFVSVIGGIAVVGRYLFPLSIITGAGCLTIYYTWVEESIYSHAFSQLIRNLPDCNAQILKDTSLSYSNSTAAAQECINNKNCVAFDWKGTDIGPDGNIINNFGPPQTTFYSNIGSGCEQAITSSSDHLNLFRYPIFLKGNGSPHGIVADVYLDVTTANYYFFDQETRIWIKQGSFAHSDFTSRNSVDWGNVEPSSTTQGIPGSIYVYYAKSNPIYFHVYVKNPDAWKLYTPSLKGPGLIPNTPPKINVTGFITIKRRNWLLYMGTALLLVGVFGSVIAFVKKPRNSSIPAPQRSTNPFEED